jgi:K+ transporter
VSSPAHPRALVPVTLTAIGVVYGDIGTSPLYALRECFFGSHSVPPTHDNVLGVLSLIVYLVLLVISVKYIAIVLRADNQAREASSRSRRSSRERENAAACSSCSASSALPCCIATA